MRSRCAGDLLCHVVVETPVKLTERQKELLREFDAINRKDGARHNPRGQVLHGQGEGVLRGLKARYHPSTDQGDRGGR